MKFAVIVAGLFAVLSSGVEACETGSNLQHPVAGAVFRKFAPAAESPFARKIRLKTGLDFSLHLGQDYKGASGEPVHAAEFGTVIVAAGPYGNYGNYVRIDHGNGLQTAYGHLLNFNVKPGQCVSKGEVIGPLGNTGFSAGPHLHFEVFRNGEFADPGPLLLGRQ